VRSDRVTTISSDAPDGVLEALDGLPHHRRHGAQKVTDIPPGPRPLLQRRRRQASLRRLGTRHDSFPDDLLDLLAQDRGGERLDQVVVGARLRGLDDAARGRRAR